MCSRVATFLHRPLLPFRLQKRYLHQWLTTLPSVGQLSLDHYSSALTQVPHYRAALALIVLFIVDRVTLHSSMSLYLCNTCICDLKDYSIPFPLYLRTVCFLTCPYPKFCRLSEDYVYSFATLPKLTPILITDSL